MKRYILGILLGLSLIVHAQKENYNWTFGNKAGLTWNETQSFEGKDFFAVSGGNTMLLNLPKRFTTQMNTSEGCFSVSNRQGNLLFYSDGINIWNSNHQKINTSNPLTGHSSSAQSGFVLPYPNSPDKYIILSLGIEPGTFAWSDITHNNNSLTFENTINAPINAPSGYYYKEIVSAVRSNNKKDYWIVIPARPSTLESTNTTIKGNYILNVYKVDENGVNITPVAHGNTSTDIVATYGSYGQIKFNKAGNRFAFVSHNRNDKNVLIADFDGDTGAITPIYSRSIGINGEQIYSVEFDPTDQYIYMTVIGTSPETLKNSRNYTLYIFKVADFINSSITNNALRDYGIKISGKTMETNNNPSFGAILRGIDDRLYITDNGTSNVFVIPNPSDPENLKIYLLKEILGSDKSLLGLPTFASFYINTSSQLTSNDVCINKPLNLNITITNGDGFETYQKIKIDFGDGKTITKPLLDANETDFELRTDPSTGDKIIHVNHTYVNDGNYTIRISILDTNDKELLETINTQLAKIYTCHLKVNPHIRIQL